MPLYAVVNAVVRKSKKPKCSLNIHHHEIMMMDFRADRWLLAQDLIARRAAQGLNQASNQCRKGLEA